jgi:hypothetical protein
MKKRPQSLTNSKKEKKKAEEKRQMSVEDILKMTAKGLGEGRTSMRQKGNLHSKIKERAL